MANDDTKPNTHPTVAHRPGFWKAVSILCCLAGVAALQLAPSSKVGSVLLFTSIYSVWRFFVPLPWETGGKKTALEQLWDEAQDPNTKEALKDR